MSHLESLLAEYLEWQGFLIRKNAKVEPLKHGGYEMELDIVAYNPGTRVLLHYEPSLDSFSWSKREARYKKKFDAGRKYIFRDLFPWLPHSTVLRQIAVFPSHPQGKDTIAGGDLMSVDELISEIRSKVTLCGIASKNAIPEQFPLLRTLQLSHCGYHGVKK